MSVTGQHSPALPGANNIPKQGKPIYPKLSLESQAQEQDKRFSADFVINNYPITTSEHERDTPSTGVVVAADVPIPLSLTIKGPPTLRRIDGAKGSRPYVVSNGGDPINAGEGFPLIGVRP